jgi:two-component system, OmpR family, sensor histidine kinase VicK
MSDIAMKDGRTHILYGVENALSYGNRFMKKAKLKMDITFDRHAPSIVIKIPVYYEGYEDILRRGGKIRCITEITKDNIQYCNQLLNIVSELRHLDGLKGGIAITETEYMATTILKEEQPLTEVIYSNAKEVVSQNQYIFDTLWNSAIPAVKKIKEIEEGVEIEFVKVIDDPIKSKNSYINNLKKSTRELSLLIPSNFLSSNEKDARIYEIINGLLKDPNVKIKVLLYHKTKQKETYIFKEKNNNFQLRYIEKDVSFKSLDETAIAIMDRKFSMILELKKDSKASFGNSIVFSIESNNKIFVASYIAIFESLWNYLDLLEQLKNAENKIQIQKESLQKQIDNKSRHLLKVNSELKRLNKVYAKKERDLRSTNETLIEIEYKKDEFISMIAHELRTPLVPIKGYTEMLLKSGNMGTLNRKQEKAIETIYRNVKKQESLVEDILDVYKLDLGKIILSKKKILISELFTNVINDSKSLVDEKKIEILCEIQTRNDTKIYCDGKRIEQVLFNLIKNSIDFVSEKDGQIVLIVKEESGKKEHNLIFNVKDNGPGIPKEKIGDLFRKFYQIDTSPTRRHAGTGLGLVICKGIIESHGGNIWVDKEYSKGFSIMFSLPLNTKE